MFIDIQKVIFENNAGENNQIIEIIYSSNPPSTQSIAIEKSGTLYLTIIDEGANNIGNPQLTKDGNTIISKFNSSNMHTFINYYEIPVNAGDTFIATKGNGTKWYFLGSVA